MHTLGYRFRPWTAAKSIADGAVDPRLRARDRARGSASTARSASATASCGAEWSSAEARWTVEVERADTRRDACSLTCGFLWVCSGYYRYDEGYTPEFPGVERFGGAGRPPPALAGGPRLRRQAGRRDRQRRDRGDAGAGDGRAGRPRDDAAALADLHRLAAGRRPDRQRAAPLPARQGRLRDRALEERAAPGADLPAQPPPPASWSSSSSARASSARCRPATTSTSTSSRRTTPGTSACAWCPTATSSRRSATATRRSSPTRSRPSPRAGSSSTPASELEADVIVTATGLNLLFLGGMELVVDGEPVDVSEKMAYKGMMLAACPTAPSPSATPTPPGR